MPWQVQVRGCRHLSRSMLRYLFQRQRHAMEISHRFWLGNCEGFGHGSAGGHRSMRVNGGARSAAVRDPKVRLRGLSEIATNAWGKADAVRVSQDAYRCVLMGGLNDHPFKITLQICEGY